MAAEIIVGVLYAQFQEFGTGRRGASSDPGPTPDEYLHGASKGIEAQPFLRPAIDEHKAAFVRALIFQIRNEL